MQGYQVGNRFFTYLIDAGDYAARTNQRVSYCFHDQVFKNIDWRQPVPFDLSTLYRLRAQQIRQDYDYVIVTYSGGADSQNMLDSFLLNHIHIDEIVIWHDQDITNTKDNRTNREALGVALSRAQRIVDQDPTIRLRVLGSKDTITAFHQHQDFDAKLQINQPWGGIMVPQRRGYWKNLIPEYRALVDANKRVAVVWGYDRPIIQYDTVLDRYYTFFEDRAQGYLPTALDLPIDNVLFYWSEQSPLIPVKMAQVLVEKLRGIPMGFQDSYIGSYNNLSLFDFEDSHHGRKVTRTLSNTWIYPSWNPLTFTDGKCAGNFFVNTELDYWISDRSNEDIVKIWAKNLKYYRDQYAHFTQHCDHAGKIKTLGTSAGFIKTQSYYLE